jgi:hypothetical protein
MSPRTPRLEVMKLYLSLAHDIESVSVREQRHTTSTF